jgi:DNA repair protein RadD
MHVLRPYQRDSVQAVYRYLRDHDDNPVVVIPTGGGKTPICATICRDAVLQWRGRVIVLAHVKELLEQTADKLRQVAPEIRFGVYSAGLGRRETEHAVIVAGIQSVFKRAYELGRFDLAIVDEAHLIPPDGEGMYRQFLADAQRINPQLRVIGLTATPFRMKSGSICTPDHFLNAVCYEIGVKELIRDGYLCPLITRAGLAKADTSQVSLRGGEFVADEVEAVMDEDTLVEAACAEIVTRTADRSACLIFATGVKHGRHVCRVLQEGYGVECGFVCGDTPDGERDELLARFKQLPAPGLFRRQPLKYLCNVNVLTTGFDATHIDCIALLRPTMSPGLYCQMVGRGFRLHPGKRNCLVLDFGGNVLRHGPVDQVRLKPAAIPGTGEAPAKECPECHALIATGYARCPECGFEFPPPERKKHEAESAKAGILSGQVTDTDYDVHDVRYTVHTKKGAAADAPKTMRVEYRLGLSYWLSEFVCFEHTGFARRKAETWWKARSPDPVPDTAEQAVEIANAGGVAIAEAVTVRSIAGEPYDRIISARLGTKPEPISAGATSHLPESEVPF